MLIMQVQERYSENMKSLRDAMQHDYVKVGCGGVFMELARCYQHYQNTIARMVNEGKLTRSEGNQAAEWNEIMSFLLERTM